jgi:very-short-patch-repair endonuclease
MTARDIDRAIEALARRQHGVFARHQALLLGASSSLIDRRLQAGTWIRLGAGVYALPGNPPTWRRQLKAAELSVPGAAICGRPGCAVHRLTGFRPGRPEIVVPEGSAGRNRFAIVRRYTPDRLVTVDGIRVVTAAQALVDAASTVSTARLGRALDDLVIAEAAELDAVRARYLAALGRPGLGGLRALLDERGDSYVPTESELEVALRAMVADTSVPAVRWQAPLPWLRPASLQRVDGVIDEWRVMLEGDGRRWHTRVADFERDHERDLEAIRRGYVVARFTWAQLTSRPTWCAEGLLDTGKSRISPPVSA